MSWFSTLAPIFEGNGSVAIDGFVHPDFAPVAEALRGQLSSHAGGAAVCVYHRGECVADLWGGTRDEQGNPWRQDTLSPSFSTTKGVASTLIHIMVDRGLLDYDQRVSHYWPEFAQSGKRDITVRHVLSHQSGLYHIRQMIDHAGRMLDWDYMVNAIEQTPPIHKPGTRTGYHGLTYGFLVGEILQRITGCAFSDLVRDELATPLALDGMYIGAPEDALERAAQLLWPPNREFLERPEVAATLSAMSTAARFGWNAVRPLAGLVGIDFDVDSIFDALAPRGIRTFDFGATETLRVAIPAGNGLFTARSLARMYAALAGGGEIDGVRLLSRATLDCASEPQLEAAGRAVLPFDMRWRLGYHGIFTTRGIPRRAFGHFGFGGSGAWADPQRDLAVAMIVNCGMGTPFGDTRVARLSGTALAAANRRYRASQRQGRTSAAMPNSLDSSETASA